MSPWAGAWGVRGHQDWASVGMSGRGAGSPPPDSSKGLPNVQLAHGTGGRGGPAGSHGECLLWSVCSTRSSALGVLEPTPHAGWCGVGYGQESWGAWAPPGSPPVRVLESLLSHSLCSGARPASRAGQRQPGLSVQCVATFLTIQIRPSTRVWCRRPGCQCKSRVGAAASAEGTGRGPAPVLPPPWLLQEMSISVVSTQNLSKKKYRGGERPGLRPRSAVAAWPPGVARVSLLDQDADSYQFHSGLWGQ